MVAHVDVDGQVPKLFSNPRMGISILKAFLGPNVKLKYRCTELIETLPRNQSSISYNEVNHSVEYQYRLKRLLKTPL